MKDLKIFAEIVEDAAMELINNIAEHKKLNEHLEGNSNQTF